MKDQFSHALVTEADLHAYIDGLLPLSRCAEIESYLASHPAEAERLKSYLKQSEALHMAFDSVLDEPLPKRLTVPPTPACTHAWHLQRIAACVAIAFTGGIAGWYLHGQTYAEQMLAKNGVYTVAQGSSSDDLARQAAIAHVVYSPDVRRPVEIGADQEDQLVTWLSKRLGTPIRPPKLGQIGYELIGGRLLPGQSGPVAQFMYQDVAGQRLTLYVTKDQTQNHDTRFRFEQEGPVNVFYWIDGRFGYALSAGIGRKELARIAKVVYEQIASS
ncbi:anti-sigma factor [Limnobacter sp.]|uniref:anti-sigma factor family protein n=1 Tax=Limnobacter sp. TaxID=2003368 RepID=UPI002587F80F|nr:anti-sigma factor [Limnobacter sp.]